jgi:hypothetical protein
MMFFFVTLPVCFFFMGRLSSKNPQTEHAFEAKLFVPQFCATKFLTAPRLIN